MRWLAAFAIGVMSAFPCLAQQDEAPPEELVSLLPASGAFEGLAMQGDPKYYAHDDLADYINGDAETYYTYGIGYTAAVRYQDGARGLLNLDIYDMLTPLGAFGVYAQRRPSDPEYLDLGAQGYVSGTQVVFISGRYYVVIKSVSRSDEGIEKAKELAAIVDEAAPGPKELPEALKWFPEDGLLDDTFAHSPSSFLGLEDMPPLFTAKYAHPDEEDDQVTLAFSLFETEADMLAAAATMQESLAGRLADDGEVSTSQIELVGNAVEVGSYDVKYRGQVHVAPVGRALLVAARTTPEHATELLAALAERIDEEGPGLGE